MLLAVRLYWGFQFAQTGWGKLHNLAKITSFFASLNVPLPGFTAPAISTLEFVGDILLMLGLFSRPIAFLLACNMFVAYWTADREGICAVKEPRVSVRTEAETIAAILGCETQLFHELIRPHERSVYLMALSYMKNEVDAEDLAQEAFVRAFRNLGSFRAESKFSTWLISITLNEARTRFRRKMLVPMDSLDAPPDEDRMFLPRCYAIGTNPL